MITTGTAVLGLVLVVVAALAALIETAITRLGRAAAMALAQEDRRGAPSVAGLVARPAAAVAPLVLVRVACHVTVVGAVAVEVAGSETRDVVGALALTAVLLALVVEVVPRIVALRRTQEVVLAAAPALTRLIAIPPFSWLGWVADMVAARSLASDREQPVVVSDGVIRAMADVAAEEEVLESDERHLIHSIIEFGDTVAREVMVPRPDMVTVTSTDAVADVVGLAVERGFSRFPVTGDNIDDVVGVVFVKDLMRVQHEGGDTIDVSTVTRPTRFVPETKRVAELLREMQAEKFHLAVVVDEYGGTAGLVTLEDLVEELVGEIVDEFDVEDPLVEALPSGALRVDARLPVDEANELLRSELPSGDWNSVGGLLFGVLGHVPVVGEHVVIDGLRLSAEKVNGRRIGKVRIDRVAPPAAETPDGGADAPPSLSPDAGQPGIDAPAGQRL